MTKKENRKIHRGNVASIRWVQQSLDRFLRENTEWDDSRFQSACRLMISSVRELERLIAPRRAKKNNENRKRSNDAVEKNPPAFSPEWVNDARRFAREALRAELFDHQLRLIESTARTTVMIAGRGAGKSFAALTAALFFALRQPGHTVLVVSSGQRMSSEFGGRLLQLLGESPLGEMAAETSRTRIVFHNGSTVHLLPANPETIRGYHPARGGENGGMTVILDEACFMENGAEVRKAVEYALITTSRERGRLYIVSSPSSMSSWVYEYIRAASGSESDVSVIQCPSEANTLIPLEEIERLRREKNELEFRAEVLGEWVEGAFGLFSGLVDACRVDRASLPPGQVHALGADLALSFSKDRDRSVLAVASRFEYEGEPCYAIVALEIFELATDRGLCDAAARLIESCSIERAAIEQYQGKSLAEFCQSHGVETELTAPTSGRQRQLFHEMHSLMRKKRLWLPADLPALFFEELKAFEYRREGEGRIVFGHPAAGGVHDDTVYAAAWALYALMAESILQDEDAPFAPFIRFLRQ